ncbi:hypothetical protein K439DRAFT_1637556 [Ramaria rubella]|nr:hypothetical protein K439DRAFT_1637556 [Ramaria rubella]
MRDVPYGTSQQNNHLLQNVHIPRSRRVSTPSATASSSQKISTFDLKSTAILPSKCRPALHIFGKKRSEARTHRKEYHSPSSPRVSPSVDLCISSPFRMKIHEAGITCLLNRLPLYTRYQPLSTDLVEKNIMLPWLFLRAPAWCGVPVRREVARRCHTF